MGRGIGSADGGRGMRVQGAIALALLFVLGVFASRASAEPVSLAFTEARGNVGFQLSDAALFEAPATAPFAAQIDPGNGAISGGALDVPAFSTLISEPIVADVTVEFEIGVISGTFTQATGALTLSGTAGGTLSADGAGGTEEGECIVTTTPSTLTLSTAGNSGGAARAGNAVHGARRAGAIAGQWTDMQAAPVDPEPGGDTFFCENVEGRIGGPGGIWLEQEDLAPPAAPQLSGTDPASPGSSGTPRIRGAAEAGSTVNLFAGTGCGGSPIATVSAAELGSPGVAVNVAEGVTATFSAIATDAASNKSACSAPISYTRQKATTDRDNGIRRHPTPSASSQNWPARSWRPRRQR